MAGGCINVAERVDTPLSDGTVHETVVTTHVSPFTDSQSFAGYQCSPQCMPVGGNGAVSPGAFGGVMYGVGAAAVTQGAPLVLHDLATGDKQ